MKGFDTGRDKVKKICDILKKETLEPAKEEAEKLLADTKTQAEEILVLAKMQAEVIKAEARSEMEKERNVFQSSLGQACRQAMESLRQDIETRLLDQTLAEKMTQMMQQPSMLVDLIKAVIKAIEKEGVDVSLSAYVSAAVPARAVNELLAQEFLAKLREKSVLVGNLSGGIEIVLRDDKITIDLSDKALKDLVAYYIRKDFRTLIFG